MFRLLLLRTQATKQKNGRTLVTFDEQHTAVEDVNASELFTLCDELNILPDLLE